MPNNLAAVIQSDLRHVSSPRDDDPLAAPRLHEADSLPRKRVSSGPVADVAQARLHARPTSYRCRSGQEITPSICDGRHINACGRQVP
jgi:hypothetical protein